VQYRTVKYRQKKSREEKISQDISITKSEKNITDEGRGMEAR
jgi:hypothetical protein